MSLSYDELGTLFRMVQDNSQEILLDAFSKANRMGTLPELCESLGLGYSDIEENANTKPKRVLVIGEPMITEGQMRSIIRKCGFDDELFDFDLGYKEFQHYNFNKLRNSTTYCAVLVGAIPHSTPGKGNCSSFIAEVRIYPDVYPPVIPLRDSAGTLKITAKGLKRGLKELEELVA